MAVGEHVAYGNTLANSTSYDIRPNAGNEWEIHEIWCDGAIALSRVDSSGNVTAIDSLTAAGEWNNYHWGCDNDRFLRLTNSSGGTRKIGYMGVQTK